MHGFTWHREKHSLFDTEAKEDKLSRINEVLIKETEVRRKDKDVYTYNMNALDDN